MAGTFRAGLAPFSFMQYSAAINGFVSYPLVESNTTTTIFGIKTNYVVDPEGNKSAGTMAYEIAPEIANQYKKAVTQQCTSIQEYALKNGDSSAYGPQSQVPDMARTTGIEAWRTGCKWEGGERLRARERDRER